MAAKKSSSFLTVVSTFVGSVIIAIAVGNIVGNAAWAWVCIGAGVILTGIVSAITKRG